ncbi:hypothetical protein GCM10008090_33320 [Arenicella chitinivorans]|uniref:Uncharacterized protein n=2 Tax=Arenicella chitinivorans TaxID=1329800 RepID=A0A918S1T7_9GAMM|nr:hypothetical protein GCM10008090_33320 [Arenicella chitinivorans]
MPSAAQFENDLIAKILDLATYQPFSDRYQTRRDDVTFGVSSLQVLPSQDQNGGVTGGYFVDDFVTITFDYKYNKFNAAKVETLDLIFGSPQGLITKQLEDTNNQWCTRSYYLTRNVGSFQWAIIFDHSSGPISEVLFDHFRIESGNNVKPWRCFDTSNESTDSQASAIQVIPSILGLLLVDDQTTTAPETAKVFGKLRLPSGVVAPAGGLEVDIRTFPVAIDFGGSSLQTSSAKVTIPAGETEVDYEFPFLISGDGVTRDLEYECLKGCAEIDVTTGGFWSNTTGTTDFFGATSYDVNTSVNVPITLEPADSYSGGIDFPGTEVASGEEQIVVSVEQATSGFDFPTVFSFYYYPEAGDAMIPFEIGVPTDSSTLGWTIRVKCNNCSAAWENATQYISRPAGYELSRSSVASHLFQSDADYDNIFLTLLLKPAP